MTSLLRKLSFLILRSRRDWRNALILLGMMTVAAALEAVGIGLIMPYISLIQDPTVVDRSSLARALMTWLGATSTIERAQLAGMFLAVVFVLKNAYLTVVEYAQYRFIFGQQVKLSSALVGRYLRSPYSFHLQHNSVELIQNANYEISQFITHVVVSVFIIAVEGLTLVVVAAALLVLSSWVVPLVGAVVGLSAWLFYRLVHRRLLNLGEQSKTHIGQMLKWLQQGLGGIKETQVLGVEKYFLARYELSSIEAGIAQGYYRLVSTLPRHVLETLGVITLVAVSLVMLRRGAPSSSVLPVLGVLAVAAMRLLPSVARILSAITEVRHHTPPMNAIYNAMSAPFDERGRTIDAVVTPLPLEREIRLVNVSFRYPGRDVPAVRDVSLSIARGESIAFVGRSGSGKTTLIDVVIGLLTPSAGHIEIDGVRLDAEGLARWQRCIGYIPQTVYLSDDSILRNIAFGVEDAEIDRNRVKEVVAAARLSELVETLPEGLDTPVGERGVRLSGGQRQRIGIARALYRDPSVLVLDEATASLDNTTEQEVVAAMESVRADRTAIVIAHRLSTVRSCDRLVFMHGGTVEQMGTWEELVAVNQEFRKLVELSAHSEVRP